MAIVYHKAYNVILWKALNRFSLSLPTFFLQLQNAKESSEKLELENTEVKQNLAQTQQQLSSTQTELLEARREHQNLKVNCSNSLCFILCIFICTAKTI